MRPEAWFGLYFFIGGSFVVVIAITNWDWVYNQRRVQRLASLIGRTGTRILYGLIGLGVMVFGALFGLGLID